MAFDEVRLPDDVERGAQGGPQFSTTVLPLSNGFERRNVNWTIARSSWDIGYGVQSLDTLDLVRDFFYARQGRARGFRFKDWSDFSGTTENIGTGTGSQTQYTLRKQYTSGLVTYNRPINKPVANTVSVFFNDVETTAFTLDTTTGIITFSPAPGSGVAITATYEFDVPVRFDTDQLSINMNIFDAGSIPQIPVVELRLSV